MNITIGKRYSISGMILEIISDDGKKCETRNITTKETVFMDKSVLEGAIKLGKAEEMPQVDNEK